MQMVKLKEDFIKMATKEDSEFEQKHWRGYAIIITSKTTNYLVPLRSKCKHPYCFKNEISNKYLDYSKSFELTNNKIIEKTYGLEEMEYKFYQKNIQTIKKELIKFNKQRTKFSFAVNVEKINKIQKEYKR